MKIRTKMALIATVILVGFLFILATFVAVSYTIVQQNEFRLLSAKVTASMDSLDVMTDMITIRREPLKKIKDDWILSVYQLKKRVNELSSYSNTMGITADQFEKLSNVEGLLKQFEEWFFQPAVQHMDLMIIGRANELVGSNGIMQLLERLYTAAGQERETAVLGELITLINYLDNVFVQIEGMSYEVEALNRSVESRISSNIRLAWVTGLSIALITMSATVLIIVIFSQRLVGRIQTVEGSVRQMSLGDFSTDLTIKSGDEFETLSNNYNRLKHQLQDKLNSVLNYMVAINSTMEGELDMGKVISMITSATIENTGATGAVLYMLEDGKETLTVRSSSGLFLPVFSLENRDIPLDGPIEEVLVRAEKEELHIDRDVLGALVKGGEPLFIQNLSLEDPAKYDFYRKPDNPLYFESLIAIPLRILERVIGVVVVYKTPGYGRLTDLDYTHMQTFADYASLTIDNLYNTQQLIERKEMHRELAIAADIQKGLLPRSIPSLQNAQVAAFSRAARGISGDYYDVFRLDNNKISTVICDVVGKGIPASLLMVMIRTIIRLVANSERTPGKLLTFLNKGITARIGTEYFATMSMFSYDGKSRKITYSNAAHLPMILYRSSKEQFIELDTPGLPVGVENNQVYSEESIDVQTGDVFVLYTDGITEARSKDGREYSTENLRKRIKALGSKTASEIANQVRKEIDHFALGAEQHDDQTLVVMKITS